MDPELYKAARDGNVNVVNHMSSQLHIQFTPNKNTALHIAAQFGQILCVNEILRNQPLLLRQLNIKGETPLHVAAREGNPGVVQALIECAITQDNGLENGVVASKEMVRMENEDGDTALHMAVRSGDIEVVKLLIEEDRDFPHLCNKDEETPLYLAVERGLHNCASIILETCTSPSPVGPRGRTALHAAVFSDSQESMANLLKWKESLSKVKDLSGWTPLHYAAYGNRVKRVKQLLCFDRSLAYLTTGKDDKSTPLHIAASQGNVLAIDIFLSECPDCFETGNGRGQNILHIAVEKKMDAIIEFVLQRPFFDSLMNQRDNNGNTPLHMLPISGCYIPKLIAHPRADKMIFNKDGSTPLDISSAKYKEYKSIKSKYMARDFRKFGVEGWRNMCVENTDANEKVSTSWEEMRVEKIKKKCETRLIVAALIATVTFAAGFTLPGGYNGNDGPNPGMAVLTRNVAFKAFVVTDTIAMMCSTYSVYLYFISASVDHLTEIRRYSRQARDHILYAQVAMMLAFTTGLYSVFPPSSGLSFFLCVLGCLFILAFIYETRINRHYLVTRKVR